MEVDRDEAERLARTYEHRVPFFAAKVERSFMLGTRWNDDLVSAGYWGLAQALRNRRPDAHERELSAYVSQRIIGAVIDEARSCLRRHSGREGGPTPEELEPAELLAIEDVRSPEEESIRRCRSDQLGRALEVLSIEQRRVVDAYMAGSSFREIARAEGIASGTMQVRFQKIGRTLRARSPELRRILTDA